MSTYGVDHVHEEGFLLGAHVESLEFETDGLAGGVDFVASDLGAQGGFCEEVDHVVQATSVGGRGVNESVSRRLTVANAPVFLKSVEDFVLVGIGHG